MTPPRVSIVILVQSRPERVLAALASIAAGATSTAYEIVVVLNGADQATVATVRRSGYAIRVVPVDVNLGFGGGCNLGARESQGEFLVFLNDDTIVEPGWLDALVTAADRHPAAGAIGSKILFMDGSVQEAGGVIWSDGSTALAGRGLPPGSAAFNYVREVDYCSANSLLVRREAFERAGGFEDELYFPAYYEDVDLCLKLRTLGYAVLYEPRARIRHLEGASSDQWFRDFLFKRNQRRLKKRWADELARQIVPENPLPLSEAIARPLRYERRVLVIDDRLPDATLGSGYGLMRELLSDLIESPYAVTFHPMVGHSGDPTALADLRVALFDEPLREYLGRADVSFDAVVIARPHNYAAAAQDVRRLQPQAPIIYNVEALFYRRLAVQATLQETPQLRAVCEDECAEMKRTEREIVGDAERVVTIAHEERAVVEGWRGSEGVDFMRPLQRGIEITPASYGERSEMIFTAGWMAGPHSPNVDALRWFVTEVMPRICAAIPWARLQVTGAAPPDAALDLAGPAVRFTGFVEDLASLYNRSLVAVAPIRFGAGVKIKTIEALQYGVPVVATTIGAEGIDSRIGETIDVVDDPAEFAARVTALISNEATWRAHRARVRALTERWHAEPRNGWDSVIDGAIAASRHASRSVQSRYRVETATAP